MSPYLPSRGAQSKAFPRFPVGDHGLSQALGPVPGVTIFTRLSTISSMAVETACSVLVGANRQHPNQASDG